MGIKPDDIHFQAIWEVTEALQNENQIEDALSVCLNILSRSIGTDVGLAWLEGNNDGRLHIVACSGQVDMTKISIPSDLGTVGRVFTNRQPEIINDAGADPSFTQKFAEESGMDIKNTLIVPLCTKGCCYGCFQLINKDGDISESDLILAGNLAALVSLDIEDKGYRMVQDEHRKPIIELNGVVKEYPSGDSILRVLDGIDLTIYEQEFLVILGESGCGKTTMLNIIGGMDHMTEGKMLVEGRDFSHPTERELTAYRKDYIGFVFQSYNLMPNLSALENVRFIAENSIDPLSCEEAIEMVGLTDRMGNLPSQMSGGQQQRVSIARAIAKNPKLILADEPTAALDYKTSIEVLGVFEDIIRSSKKTVIMITHNAEIAKMADRVVRLREGRISSIRINNSPLHASDLSW